MDRKENIKIISNNEEMIKETKEDLNFIETRISSLSLEPNEFEEFELDFNNIKNFIKSDECKKVLDQFVENRLLLSGVIKKMVELVNSAVQTRAKTERTSSLNRDEIVISKFKKLIKDVVAVIDNLKSIG